MASDENCRNAVVVVVEADFEEDRSRLLAAGRDRNRGVESDIRKDMM
jgi:hypothetical protein